MDDTEIETEESDHHLSDSDEDDFNDDEEVFIPSESDRELLLVSRVAHARRMRFNFKQ